MTKRIGALRMRRALILAAGGLVVAVAVTATRRLWLRSGIETQSWGSIDRATSAAADRIARAPRDDRRFVVSSSSTGQNEADALLPLLVRLDSEHPDLVRRLRPGLSATAIAEIEKELEPFRLPESLKRLHMRHDGVVDGADEIFPPDYAWQSLEKIVATRRRFIEELGWTPAWLPLAASDDAALFMSLARRDVEYPYVWELRFEDPDLYLAHESIAAMVTYIIETAAIHSRAPQTESESETPRAALRTARFRASPLAADPYVEGVQLLSWPRRVTRLTLEWPPLWQEAIGRGLESYRPKEGIVRISSLAEGFTSATVRGRLGNILGSLQESVFRLSDDSGDIQVFCRRFGCADLQGAGLYEADLQPSISGPSTLDQDAVLTIEATRLLPLDVRDAR